MKKYFLYELKRNWLAAVVITACGCLIYLTGVLNSDFSEIVTYTYDGAKVTYIPGSLVAVPQIMLMLLCALIPVLIFSFKMSARQADCFYSMPIRREKIYLVKSAVGLLLTLVPYTVAYWLGFIFTVFKTNSFVLSAFVPLYFISLPLAILLFGINAFVFTRANRPADGIIFMGLYACAAAVLITYIYRIVFYNSGLYYPSLDALDILRWFTYSPLAILTTKYGAIISGRGQPNNLEWLVYLFAGITGAAAWAGLFLTARKEKAENAERVSDSIFGYRVLIPFYLAFMLSFVDLPSSGASFVGAVIFIIAAIVGYIIFRRSVRLKAADLISLGGAFILGILLSVFI